MAYSSGASSNPVGTSGIVPNGSSYICNSNSCTLSTWSELK